MSTPNAASHSAIRDADKRVQLVGRRKSGYCGHVPQYVYFEQARSPSPTKLSGDSAARTSPRLFHGDVSYTTYLEMTGERRRAQSPTVQYPVRESSPSRATGPTQHEVIAALCHYAPPPKPRVPKQIVGYCGHREGLKFSCGSSTNAPRKTDLLALADTRPQLFSPELGKPTPIPVYPVIRGPTRAGPFGLESFLTN